jgi:CRP-like cAMP-binding protein
VPPRANRLLARLGADDYLRLSRHFQAVPLSLKQVVYRARGPVEYAYFPLRGALSALSIMGDGRAIEVANVGNEGMVGLPGVFGSGTSHDEVIVQGEGEALRLPADVLRREAGTDGPVRRWLAAYHDAYAAQVSCSVACNGLHKIGERCCRWLLMTHDRVGADELPLTHEFLAMMLGVRRPGVTEVLQGIQERGLIACGRGRITVRDRPGLEAASCECYRRVRDEYERLLGPEQPR